ncbi:MULTISPECIES: hypothetical protein [unclassified Colwellia]|jgi:hypothetical protein|uniref:hypothetical protein n=1 Tax=unclassified Colwellia TaxID=196834 RepID=UPI0015F60798|nr:MULTISPECIES: hypothetical protein [unclassified Colwellia]MBA6252051.1 hypothetical protein [Colwellia sp. MB3u-55]MBA6262197.1 hypothetical protein [Colwellia sp. Bg11-12]
MNMYWRISLALALIIGIFYSFPPYTAQATYYYLTHSSELNTMDIAFTESDDKTWEYKNRKLAPIFKTKDGSRLYFMGSLKRFKKQYDIAFIKGDYKKDFCTPYLIYTSQQFNCNIPLNNGWVINYQGFSVNTI